MMTMPCAEVPVLFVGERDGDAVVPMCMVMARVWVCRVNLIAPIILYRFLKIQCLNFDLPKEKIFGMVLVWLSFRIFYFPGPHHSFWWTSKPPWEHAERYMCIHVYMNMCCKNHSDVLAAFWNTQSSSTLSLFCPFLSPFLGHGMASHSHSIQSFLSPAFPSSALSVFSKGHQDVPLSPKPEHFLIAMRSHQKLITYWWLNFPHQCWVCQGPRT